MEEGQQDSQQFIKSRIFISKQQGAKVVVTNKSSIQLRTPEETFQHKKFFGKPPSKSIHNMDQTEASGESRHSQISSWITVVGVLPGRYEEVLNFFSQFGEVTEFEEGVGNLAFLEYKSEDVANSVNEKASNEPIMINSQYIVGIELGRIKNKYTPIIDYTPSKEKFQPIPKVPTYTTESRSIASKIFGSIFGTA